jgi:hypothetical protein
MRPGSLSSFSSVVSAAVVAAYDFSSSAIVVDIGDGDGTLLAAILKGNPSLRGVVRDLPHAAGSFFESVPVGDTAPQSAAILRNCRTAMAKNRRVLLVEAVIQPGAANSSLSIWI